jgi:tRNA(fMet)-specific endonuclease VapC
VIYALDTNTVVYFFKGLGQVADRLLAVPPQRVRLPSVALYELETGVAKLGGGGRRRRQLSAFVEMVGILPFAADEARTAARIRATLEASGNPIGPLDTLIAATALSYGATLVTRNVREFERVEGLQVENWY